jgi:nucleotide-binding universal stress UspA family protein
MGLRPKSRSFAADGRRLEPGAWSFLSGVQFLSKGNGMALFRKILIAVDDSQAGLNALREGCRLGRGERARMVAVTVAPAYEGDLNLVGVRNLDGVINEPCTAAVQATQRIAQEEGVAVEHLATTGDISERITEVAADYGCDLVILGCERRLAVWRLLLSSVIPAVIAASPCDVLVFPQDTRFDWRSVLLAVSEPQTAVRPAQRALGFARAYGARMLIASPEVASMASKDQHSPASQQDFHEWERSRFLAELIQQAESNHVSIQLLELPGRLPAAAIRVAREHQVGLVILGWDLRKYQWSILGERGVALAIQRFSHPVLVVPS